MGGALNVKTVMIAFYFGGEVGANEKNVLMKMNNNDCNGKLTREINKKRNQLRRTEIFSTFFEAKLCVKTF